MLAVRSHHKLRLWLASHAEPLVMSVDRHAAIESVLALLPTMPCTCCELVGRGENTQRTMGWLVVNFKQTGDVLA
jgi:hypothetical protein